MDSYSRVFAVVSKDQFEENYFSINVRSITPYFHVLSYLCEYLMGLLVLSHTIWFSFYPYDFYSCILLRVHSIQFNSIQFNSNQQINKCKVKLWSSAVLQHYSVHTPVHTLTFRIQFNSIQFNSIPHLFHLY